jgi:hypothetical protein
MTHFGDEHERQAGGASGTPGTASRWGETFLIWFVVAVGGCGLWLSSADPLFGGGADGVLVALTVFAFFVALGVAATVAIWWLPAFWDRWFYRLPPDGGGWLDAAKMLVALLFWVLAVVAVVHMVAAHWHPVAIGTAAGGFVLLRLVVEIWLHHRQGK